MSRYKREIELTAKPQDGYRFPIYANRVDIKRVAATDKWLIASLTVNFGVSLNSFFDSHTQDRDIAEHEIAQGEYSTDGKLLTAFGVYAGEKIDFYTLDLTKLIPEGWEFNITPMGSRLRQIGVIAYEPGYEHETLDVHVLSVEDLNAWGDEPCKNFFQDSWNKDHKVPCQREEGHLGDHQAVHDERVYKWERSGSSSISPNLLFGFTCRCPHCGEVDAGGTTAVKMCFSCEHWLRLEKARDEDCFIIAGRHYMPGKGGFGGHKFKVRRHDGTIWEGELFTQGEAPVWMLDRFPDNAEFVVEKVATTDRSGTVKTVYSGSLADAQAVAWDELRKLSELDDF